MTLLATSLGYRQGTSKITPAHPEDTALLGLWNATSCGRASEGLAPLTDKGQAGFGTQSIQSHQFGSCQGEHRQLWASNIHTAAASKLTGTCPNGEVGIDLDTAVNAKTLPVKVLKHKSSVAAVCGHTSPSTLRSLEEVRPAMKRSSWHETVARQSDGGLISELNLSPGEIRSIWASVEIQEGADLAEVSSAVGTDSGHSLPLPMKLPQHNVVSQADEGMDPCAPQAGESEMLPVKHTFIHFDMHELSGSSGKGHRSSSVPACIRWRSEAIPRAPIHHLEGGDNPMAVQDGVLSSVAPQSTRIKAQSTCSAVSEPAQANGPETVTCDVVVKSGKHNEVGVLVGGSAGTQMRSRSLPLAHGLEVQDLPVKHTFIHFDACEEHDHARRQRRSSSTPPDDKYEPWNLSTQSKLLPREEKEVLCFRDSLAIPLYNSTKPHELGKAASRVLRDS